MVNVRVQRGIAIFPENEKEIVVELKHPVDMERAFIVSSGSIYGYSNGAYDSNSWDARLALVDSKYLSIKRAHPSVYEAEVSWQVVYWGEPELEEPEPEKEIDWDNDIDWEKVPMDTEVLVRDDLEEDWEEAFFCCSVPEKYMIFDEGYTSGEAVTATFYNYCKLANPEDIEKYKKAIE